jgi:hypothetical protein
MVAGILLNYGADNKTSLFSNNIYTGKPSITLFKSTYIKHTNFAIESIQQTGNIPSLGGSITFDIPDNGDLLYKTYLELTLNDANASSSDVVPYVGLRAIDYIEFSIGGTLIDKQYSEWMYIWNELALPPGKKEGYFSMVGGPGKVILHLRNKIIIPLQFWFCRSPKLALPLKAINQSIQIKIQFNPESKINNNSSGSINISNASLWTDIIFLDTTESSNFVNKSHYYLIEQLQKTTQGGIAGTSTSFNIDVGNTITKTIKELFIVGHIDDNNIGNWFNYSNVKNKINNSYQQYSNIYSVSNILGPNNYISSGSLIAKNIITSMRLTLGGNDRFRARDGNYFNLTQPYQHHTSVPNNVGINVYSFSLNPEELQPSGSCNFNYFSSIKLQGSMSIDSASSSSNITFTIYAINYEHMVINGGYISLGSGGGGATRQNIVDVLIAGTGTGEAGTGEAGTGDAGTGTGEAGTGEAGTGTDTSAAVADTSYIEIIPGLGGQSLTGRGKIEDTTNTIDTDDVSTNLLMTNLRPVDSNGTTVNSISVGQQIQLSAMIQNTQSIPQIFKYNVTVTDKNGLSFDIDSSDNTLLANSSINPAVAWKPATSGQYTLTASIVDDQNNTLAQPITTTISVTGINF